MTPPRRPSVRRPEPLRVTLLAAALLLSGCGKKEEAAPPPPPPPPPPKVEVKPETVAEIVQRLGLDARVRMDEGERPNTGDASKDLARLEMALKFLDGMVTGKADAVRPLLTARDQATLEAMVKDGQWKRASEGIDRANAGWAGDKMLVLYTVGDRFDVQLWEVVQVDGEDRLNALPQPPGIVDQLKGSKADPRIQQWEKIVKEFTDKGKEPDENPELPQQDRTVAGESGGSGSDSPSPSPAPSPGPAPAPAPGKKP